MEPKMLSPYINPISTIVLTVGGRGARMEFSNSQGSSKLLAKVHGYPFLKFVLDMVLRCGFSTIYLLTGNYDGDIRRFLADNNYDKSDMIRVIYGGTDGIFPALLRVKPLIKESFVYMDGNIICPPAFIHQLSLSHITNKSFMTLALSREDIAPTHLQVLVRDQEIYNTSVRLTTKKEQPDLSFREVLYSMGIMAINPELFDLPVDPFTLHDLDMVVDFVLRNRSDLTIHFLKHIGKWYCIHTQVDLAFIEEKGAELFDTLLIKTA